MPELPEVETVRRGLLPAMEGKRFLRVEQRRANLRFPFPDRFAARLEGTRIVSLTRRAKYLLAALESGETLVMHLGMSGSFLIDKTVPGAFHHPRFTAQPNEPKKHDHVVFEMSGGGVITYNDPRRFGFMDLIGDVPSHALFKNIGIEPLGNELSGSFILTAFKGKAAPLKAALLDQSLICGLGNIYVCEALFRSQLSPFRAAGSLSGPEAELLAQVIRTVLEEAIAAGGSTLNDFSHADGTLGYFQHRFQVYDREGEACVVCAAPILRKAQSGRSTFYCAACQV